MTPITLALNDLAQTLYRDTVRTIRPMYPWVLVYMLPREIAPMGRIILPESQNKPVLEAIVLQTWEKADQKSVLQAGDHVLMQHFAGMPYGGFRLVCEVDKGVGIILAVLEREEENSGVSGLVSAIKGVASLHAVMVDEITAAIQQRFILVDRKTGSVTISGTGQD